jgi:hypothetical protein
MLAPWGRLSKSRLSKVELPRFIGSGIAASAAAHLTILAVILIFAEVHPFSSVTAEPIAVDIVTPDEAAEVPKKEEPKPKPTDVFNFSAASSASSSSAPPAPQEGAAKPQKQAALTPPLPDPQRKGVELQAPPPSATLPTPSTQFATQTPSTPAAPPAPAAQSAPNPAYVAPEPDLSVKYNVMLGLPPPPPDRAGGGFDAVASDKADVASGVVAEFRRHLRTCSRLPPSIAPSESVRIKLRVLMTPDGKLAAEPAVVEGSASIKALDLKQSAIDALRACQPYTMLPADRYREWKALDLSFTPADFNS